ncbi:MAG: hypothetical protein H7177_00900 [Rhizobacter sp.]|nr:hypothetical protein [Bacteriovorax sp.]
MKTLSTIFLFLLSFLYLNNAYASTDTLTVTGSGNTGIDITTTKTNLSVSSFTLKNSSGTNQNFQVSMTSQNGGLKNSNAATKGGVSATYLKGFTMSFTISAGSALVNSGPLDTTTIGTTKTLFFTATEGGSPGLTGSLKFSITGTPAAQLYSGTYTDVLTFEAKNLTTTINPLVTKTLIISAAVINDTITLTITPTASASNLPLTSTQSALNVGSVNITANCQNGYLLMASSTNSGNLVNTSVATPGANDKISYSLSFAATPLTLTTTPTTFSTVSNATMYSSSSFLGNLTMGYSGVNNGSKTAGSYQDVITFTLQSQ